jgi:hypothetical protein
MKSKTLVLAIISMTITIVCPLAGADQAGGLVRVSDPATGYTWEYDPAVGEDSTVVTPPPQLTVLAAVTPAGTVETLAAEDKPVFAQGERIPLPVARPVRQAGPSLTSVASIRKSKFTVYNPSINNSMEGGGRNRNGEKINSVEDAVINGRPVTLAADYTGSFGKTCNQRDHRCTILVLAPGFDSMFPAYRRKFPNLPRNSFIGIVEDTGSAFIGSNGNHFDIAVRNRALTVTNPVTIRSASWSIVRNPCGSSTSGRLCNLAEASLAPTTVAMLMN